MAKLELRELTRRFDGARAAAVAGVSLSVDEGEVLVLVGPSGCGKSTILRLIAGLDDADGGEVLIDGASVARVPPQDRDVAMVFQGYALYPHMTVSDNIAFPLRMRDTPRAETESRVADAAKLLSIEHLLQRKPAQLSGGERQRVAMGRAIVRRPRIFLFDEPLSNLDAALRTDLRAELSSLLGRIGATAIYVTHDQVEAMTIGSRVAVMRGGKVEQIGAPESIYRAPDTLFVAGFLGVPPINVVAVERDGDHATRGALKTLWPKGLEGNAVSLAFRPEHVTLAADAASRIRIEGKVAVIEPLGAESVVHVDALETRMRVRVPGFATARPGDSVTLTVDPADVLWFGANGRRHDPSTAEEASSRSAAEPDA